MERVTVPVPESLTARYLVPLPGPVTAGEIHLWVRFHAFGYRGRYWAQSDGMKHFGLPEIFVGGTERDLREELRDIALCVAFRIWSDFARRAEAAAGTHDMFATPRTLRIPAEMEIHRQHLDGARGVPNRGDTASVAVRLSLEEDEHGQPVLAVAPPASWDMGWERFIGSVCHALFGFEKPPWHYLPELGALLQALESVPEARRRFRDAELPAGGRMLVRYEDPANAGARCAGGGWSPGTMRATRPCGTSARNCRPRSGLVIPCPSRTSGSWTGPSGSTARVWSRAPARKSAGRPKIPRRA